MSAAATPARETIARKLSTLINAQVRLMFGTVLVQGECRELFVICSDDGVSIESSNGATLEVLPSGLTYKQLAAHISAVANEPAPKRIGWAAQAAGTTWVRLEAPAV